jgi:hypothetical protein
MVSIRGAPEEEPKAEAGAEAAGSEVVGVVLCEGEGPGVAPK